MRTIRTIFINVLVGVFLVGSSLAAGAGMGSASRLYTADADFDEGILAGVEHETIHDQLQLSAEGKSFPFIWVPNESDTVSKIDTETGRELGRYRTGPSGIDGEPSRTTVDIAGNVWLANRYSGTAVKIGLYEKGQCADGNGNGTIETSTDVDGDGNITGPEVLPWGQDECVLFEVVLISGREGTYVPGKYPGPYTNDWGTPGPRSISVDANNNVWVGTFGTQKFYYIDGETGAILKTVSVAGHTPYGAVIDKNGILWSAGHSTNRILRLDPSADPPAISTVYLGHFIYGLGLDYNDHLFASAWTDRRLSRISINNGSIDWTKYKSELWTARGVAVTGDNDVWVASTDYHRVTRYDNNGNYRATISGVSGPTGLSVDAAGKVWVVDIYDENIHRIDPATNKIDLTKRLIGSGGHYGYSDMTGIVSRTITTKTGSWTVIHDGGVADMAWGTVFWNAHEPEGTSVTVRARSSNDKANWSVWEAAANGNPLTALPAGRYLQVETTLKIAKGDVSPVLYDLTVKPRNSDPTADAGPDRVEECKSPDGTPVTLNGSGSSDPDGDSLTYAWAWPGGSAEGVAPTIITLPYSTTTVTLTVDDGKGGADTDDVTVTVQDTTPPETTATVAGVSGQNGWYVSDVAVTLNATDTCTGVKEIHYTVNGSETVVAGSTASFTLSQDGTYLVTYWAVDKAGREGTRGMTPVKREVSPPVTTPIHPAPPDDGNGYYRSCVPVTLSAAAGVSGVSITRYRLDNGEWKTYTGQFTVCEQDSTTITYETTSNAGNAEVPKTLTIMIDKTPPVITASVSPAPNANGWHNTDVTVTFTCSDATSGVAICPAPVTVTTEGAGQVIAGTAVDVAGNRASASVTLNIDRTAPTANISLAPGLLWPPNHKMVNVTVNGGSSDATSRVDSVVFSVADEYGTVQPAVSGFNTTIPLEAWREGADMDGRHYTVTAVITDKAGNATTISTEAVCPHDMRDKK